MSDIKDSIKTFFKNPFGKKNFKGAGHVLGSSDSQPPPPQRPVSQPPTAPAQAAPARTSSSSKPGASAGHRLGSGPAPVAGPGHAAANRLTSKQNPPKPRPTTQAPPPAPTGLGFATAQERAGGSSSPSRNGAAAASSSSSELAAGATGAYVPSSAEQEQAAALLASNANAAASAEVLTKMLRNIVANPTEVKYRRVRLSNKKVQEAVVDASGGLELLQATGFAVVFEEAAEGGASEGFAVLPEDAELAPLQAALQLLRPLLLPPAPASSSNSPSPSRREESPPALMPANQAPVDAPASGSNGGSRSVGEGAAAAAAAVPASGKAKPSLADPRPRNTKVLLPTESSTDVPDWVFEQTGAELKAAFMAAVKKRQLEQTLMTRAQRERLLGPTSSSRLPSFATVRVRLPEGLLLEGEFNAGEPVSTLFEWVTDALRDPGALYELVGPDRKPLNAGLKIRDANLLPSALLNFRFIADSSGHSGRPESTLRDELLQQAQPAA